MDISTKLKRIEEAAAKRRQRELATLEEQAFKAFCKLRWPPNGKPICSKCEFRDKVYWISTVRRWKCRLCRHQFTATTDTVFDRHKMSFVNIMQAIEALADPSLSARKLAPILDVTYKSAWILKRKYEANGRQIPLTEAGAVWVARNGKLGPGRVVGPRGRRDGKRITT